MPALKIADTASQANAAWGNDATKTNRYLGKGISFKVASVITAKVPSDPINKCVRLYPVEFFNTFAPVRIIFPSAITASRLNTYSRVTPYFTA